MRRALVIFFLFTMSLVFCASTRLQNNGVSQGDVTTLDCRGPNVSCRRSGTTGIIFVDGGGSGVTPDAHVFLGSEHTDTTAADAGDDKMIIANGTTWAARDLLNCQAANYALRYASATNTFTCEEAEQERSLMPYTGEGQRPVRHQQFNNHHGGSAAQATPVGLGMEAWSAANTTTPNPGSLTRWTATLSGVAGVSGGVASGWSATDPKAHFYYNHDPRLIIYVAAFGSNTTPALGFYPNAGPNSNIQLCYNGPLSNGPFHVYDGPFVAFTEAGCCVSDGVNETVTCYPPGAPPGGGSPPTTTRHRRSCCQCNTTATIFEISIEVGESATFKTYSTDGTPVDSCTVTTYVPDAGLTEAFIGRRAVAIPPSTIGEMHFGPVFFETN